MNYEEFASKYKDKIYKTTCTYIPDREPKKHYEMVRDYVDRKGKYGRAMLTVLWNALYGGGIEEAILPASAMQTSEDWILMHDDWEDKAELRRGKPSAYILYGEDLAINAGDALHMIDWKIAKDAMDNLNKIKPGVGDNFFRKFYEMLLTTAEGQYLDMTLTKRKTITDFTQEDYFKSIHEKTAYYSVYGPMQFGAITADADSKQVERIREYGENLGNAFQIKDDILDVTSDEKTMGKSVRNDIKEGVKTIILWHFVQNASKSDLQKAEEIYAKKRGDKTTEEINFIADKFKQYGSVDYAEQTARKMAEDALEKFNEIEKDKENDYKEAAMDVILKQVKRSK
ncbi:MAG: polyprenyl synthetase family protein [Candidatus Marsarchaeota archaeon]|nr:polyprenyl synthetase family protein [Candidatus Marsarchaeota archaeon]